MSDLQSVKVRQRSPSYPAFNLQTAIVKVSKFYEEVKRNPVHVDVAIRTLGHEIKSSNGKRAIATLLSYGLLEEVPNTTVRQVRITQLAFSILKLPVEDPDRVASIREAATKPTIYREMLQKWPDELPSNPLIEKSLTFDMGFNDEIVKILIRDFRATYAFANLGNRGILSVEETDNDSIQPDSEDGGNSEWDVYPVKKHFNGLKDGEPGKRLPSGENPMIPPATSNTKAFTLPLPGGKMATLEVPSDVGEDDFSFLARYLEFMKEAFVKKPAEPSQVAPAETANINGSEKT